MVASHLRLRLLKELLKNQALHGSWSEAVYDRNSVGWKVTLFRKLTVLQQTMLLSRLKAPRAGIMDA